MGSERDDAMTDEDVFDLYGLFIGMRKDESKAEHAGRSLPPSYIRDQHSQWLPKQSFQKAATIYDRVRAEKMALKA